MGCFPILVNLEMTHCGGLAGTKEIFDGIVNGIMYK